MALVGLVALAALVVFVYSSHKKASILVSQFNEYLSQSQSLGPLEPNGGTLNSQRHVI